MDFLVLFLIGLVLVALVVLFLMLSRLEQQSAKNNTQLDPLLYQWSGQMNQSVDGLRASIQQQASLSQTTLHDALERLNKAQQEGLLQNQHQSKQVLLELMEKFKNIDTWQNQVNDLTGRIYQLSKILDNNMLKGKFGELHLENILKNIYPSSWLTFQAVLENGNRVDCLISLGDNLPKIPIDAKFPLATFKQVLQQQNNQTALKEFVAVIKKNITDIHDKYLIPGVTTEYAILFVPSDALFLKICELDDLMAFAQEMRILLCSPQTIFWLLSLMKKFLIDYRLDKKTFEKIALLQSLSQQLEYSQDRLELLEKKLQAGLKEIRALKKQHADFYDDLEKILLLEEESSNNHAESKNNQSEIEETIEEIAQ